jgi:hypothetical protein
MNSNRFVEGATLMSVGVFCASALLSFALQSAHGLKSQDESVAMVTLPPVTVTAKRMSPEEKATWQMKEQAETMKSNMVERSSKNNAAHAG